MADKVYATGRRKTSVARVFLTPNGKGDFLVNKKKSTEYFPKYFLLALEESFKVTGTTGKFDVYVTVKGGGMTGQAQAIRHGIARALDKYDRDQFHVALKQSGLLTRDDRMVERKKFGLRKARKSGQYSKR